MRRPTGLRRAAVVGVLTACGGGDDPLDTAEELVAELRARGAAEEELEALFRGVGWNVIKVIWGDDWATGEAPREAGAPVRLAWPHLPHRERRGSRARGGHRTSRRRLRRRRSRR